MVETARRAYYTRLYIPLGSHHLYPRISFHSIKYTILLALLPLVVWFLIPSEAVDAEIVEKRVKTETIRREDMKFEDRWFPIYNPPKTVRTIPIVNEVTIEDQPARPLVAPDNNNSDRERSSVTDNAVRVLSTKRRTIRYAYRDICLRHNMRRVVTNGGRSWRCRRV